MIIVYCSITYPYDIILNVGRCIRHSGACGRNEGLDKIQTMCTLILKYYAL